MNIILYRIKAYLTYLFSKFVIILKVIMVSTNTLRTLPFKIAVVGPPGVGRSTFINSILPEVQESFGSDGAVELLHRDIKNNL